MERKTTTTGTGTEAITTDPTGNQKSFLTVFLFSCWLKLFHRLNLLICSNKKKDLRKRLKNLH